MNRRHFLSYGAGALSAGAMLPHVARAADSRTARPTENDRELLQYLPTKKPGPVVKPGEFVIAAAHLDHPHIGGQCSALVAAGATLKWVFEPEEKKRDAFLKRYKDAKVARSLDEILNDAEVKMVASAAVTSERGPLGCRVMEAGKDYFTDKAPFTTVAQVEQARAVAARTGRKYMVYYSERLTSEAGMFATDVVAAGAIGRVVQVVGFGPHRLSKSSRPAWFFQRAKYGGILCDIGSHQCEQFLTYSGATDATVVHAAVGNYANPDTPELEDFGEATFVGNNGATNQIRVDWFTPGGIKPFGDGRTFILGTKGYMELRKYIDIGRDLRGDNVYLADDKGVHYLNVDGKVGTRFFGELILDCLNRTEKAMTQAHAFKAGELCVRAQAAAKWLT